MSDIEFGSFFVQLVTAGNDTTKGMLGSGLLALLCHPDQLTALRGDRTLIPGAVEEIIRYANPLHYFRRTALADTELTGTRIAAGDKVAMYYTSANRDEEVFDRPQAFDIRRHPNPHLTFGIGSHFCLGVHMARLEGRSSSRSTLIVAIAAAQQTGLPPNVVVWRNGLSMYRSHVRGVPTQAPIGMTPPPKPLPSAIRSGVTPSCSQQNILPLRPIPHWTSSKTRRAPYLSQISRAAAR